MIITKIATCDNDFISTLCGFGFSYDLASFLYHHHDLVKINNQAFSSPNIKKGDKIELNLFEENKVYGNSKNELDILYEDDYLLIVNKPHNIATIPTIRHFNNNLASDVSNYYLNHNIKSKIHVVTRLDYETNGIVIFAKHQYIHALMSKVKIDKYYLANVHGIIRKKAVINKPILKDPNDTKKRIIDEKGKPSITEYEIINVNEKENKTTIKAHLITGRTHQIRLHFASISHPVIGDKLYGTDNTYDILYLTCIEVKFIHPITNSLIHIKIE